jgi:hypothetical protein
MLEMLRERASGWGTRASLGLLLLVFSEGIVWQTPTVFNALEWLGLAVLYWALAALALDLIARWKINEGFGLFLLAGSYGLINSTLISHITTQNLPASLLVRPLAAQPLIFLAALAAFQILGSGRATGPLDFLAALGIGLAWGVWLRWFPQVSDHPVPAVQIETALIGVGIALVLCAVIRFILPPADLYRREDWLLRGPEWVVVLAVIVGALVIGSAQGLITRSAFSLTVSLVSFMGVVLFATASLRRGDSLLKSLTPPRRPNFAAWLVLVGPFLLAGWIGFSLPGSGDRSLQSDILFGALTVFGIGWPPIISALVGVRAFIRLAREEG